MALSGMTPTIPYTPAEPCVAREGVDCGRETGLAACLKFTQVSAYSGLIFISVLKKWTSVYLNCCYSLGEGVYQLLSRLQSVGWKNREMEGAQLTLHVPSYRRSH